jgi:hypothetical protein
LLCANGEEARFEYAFLMRPDGDSGYITSMSISKHMASFAMSTFLAVGSLACGGDEDDDDDGGAIDSGAGTEADASVDEPDAAAAEPDAAAGEPDAAPPIEGDQFLLGILLTVEDSPFGDLSGVSRVIATVALDGATADFNLQPVVAPECPDAGDSGQPVGPATIVTDVPIGVDGTFDFNVEEAVFGQGSAGIPQLCTLGNIVAQLQVTGQIQKVGPCGEVEGTSIAPVPGLVVTGTFGGVAIENGTVGDDLPEAVLTCPVAK